MNMKFSLFFAVSAVAAVVFGSPAFGAMDLTFDMTKLGNSSLTTSNVFVTFAAANATMTYGSGDNEEQIVFTGGNITIDGNDYGTSRAYSLAEIQANGLVLNSSTSLIGYISYGSAVNIEKLPPGGQPSPQDSDVPRFSNFEVTYSGTGGGADLTNISQFGGSLRMEFLADSTTQSYVQNTLNTGDMFRALATASGNASSAQITNGGQFVRMIGPNTFPSSIAGQKVQNPYPKFNQYLQHLNETNKKAPAPVTIVQEITNLAPGADPGGQGAAGFQSMGTAAKVTPSTIYNLDYHFTVNVVQETPPTPNDPDNPGTYGVSFTGYVNATNPDTGDTVVYGEIPNELSIYVSGDDLTNEIFYMTNFLYQQAAVGADIDVSFTGWDDLTSDFGAGTVQGALQYKVTGDFSEGILTGMVGSIVDPGEIPALRSTVDPGETPLGELSSYQWWGFPELAYGPAQPGASFYSPWGDVISANSTALNDGITYDRLGVYGSPYDDRFSLNLIAPDSSTTEMRITLSADGNLSVVQ